MKKEVEFLCFILGNGGISVDPNKVDVMQSLPKPENVTDLLSFMGLVQFFALSAEGFRDVPRH